MMAGATETALHFVGDADSAMLADDVVDDLEEFFGWSYHTANTLNWLADEAGDLTRRFVLNDVLNVLGAFHAARRVLEAEWAAVAVAGHCVVNVRAVVAFELPIAMGGQAHRHRGATVIAVAKGDYILVACVLAG